MTLISFSTNCLTRREASLSGNYRDSRPCNPSCTSSQESAAMTICMARWTAAAKASTVFGPFSAGAGQLMVKDKKTQRLSKNSPPGVQTARKPGASMLPPL